MHDPDLEGMSWLISSHSNGNDGDCVEVGRKPGLVAIRDSKNRTGPALKMSPAEFARFRDWVATGQADL